jgi:hypothetical protein
MIDHLDADFFSDLLFDGIRVLSRFKFTSLFRRLFPYTIRFPCWHASITILCLILWVSNGSFRHVLLLYVRSFSAEVMKVIRHIEFQMAFPQLSLSHFLTISFWGSLSQWTAIICVAGRCGSRLPSYSSGLAILG